MFRTITAKYAGICRRCNGPITIGQKIRYGGTGRTYHLKTDCETTAADDAPILATANDADDAHHTTYQDLDF